LFGANVRGEQDVGCPGGIGSGAELIGIAHAVAIEVVAGENLQEVGELALRGIDNGLAEGIGETIADGVAAGAEIEAPGGAGAADGGDGADGIDCDFTVVGIGQREGDGCAGFEGVIAIGRGFAVEGNLSEVVAAGHAGALDGGSRNDAIAGAHQKSGLILWGERQAELGCDLSIVVERRLWRGETSGHRLDGKGGKEDADWFGVEHGHGSFASSADFFLLPE